jgi:signal transduction histidine kinase
MGASDENGKRGKTSETERQLQVLRRLIDFCERDRRLMAYEIHDGPVQQMTGCLMHLQTLEGLHGNENGRAATVLRTGIQLLKDAIAEARRLINGLRPPILDEVGIVGAIEHLVCKSRETHGPAIEFAHAVQFVRLASPLEHAIFRVVQESVSNACRHSRSPRVRISLRQHGARIHLEIRDWGVGFDPDAVRANRFGLKGIRERARVMRGTASIDSTAGQGTCISVDLPVVEALLGEDQ